jgi:hypothetical protein
MYSTLQQTTVTVCQKLYVRSWPHSFGEDMRGLGGQCVELSKGMISRCQSIS